MMLEEARRAAHVRGNEMRPVDPSVDIDGLFDQVDVADLIHAVLSESHPVGSAPSQRFNRAGYEQWQAEQEAIRAAIWEAFDRGTRGLAFRPTVPVLQAA